MSKQLMREVKDDGVSYEKPLKDNVVYPNSPIINVNVNVAQKQEDEETASESKQVGGKQLLTEG